MQLTTVISSVNSLWIKVNWLACLSDKFNILCEYAGIRSHVEIKISVTEVLVKSENRQEIEEKVE
jgi:hypothetical protein